MKNFRFLSLCMCAMLWASCGDKIPITPTYPEVKNLDEMKVPDNFNYELSREVNVRVLLQSVDGSPLKAVKVQINGLLEDGSLSPILDVMTNQDGIAETSFALPMSDDTVIVSPNFIGLPNHLIVPVKNNAIQVTVGRPNATSFTTLRQAAATAPNGLRTSGVATILRYKYLSTYNSLGVPGNLIIPRDVVTSSMLQMVNTSLPENNPVPVAHPEFLNNKQVNLEITAYCDVWLTFVHEGAGYKNTLGFYTYPTGNPPTSISQIDTVYLAFPNASFNNSGGGLTSGDKVKIGTFNAGTTIGFVTISNGWTTSGVGDGLFRIFSNKELNNLSNPNLNQHHVLLHDQTNGIFFIGCEDILRSNSNCDNDFNDIVFYAKSNPITAISTNNVAKVDVGADADGDGVPDASDQFPNNPNLAYRTFIPGANTFNTLAFEDLWPGKGDFDMNDLVVGYQYEQLLNAQNQVVSMKGKFVTRAIGASYKNGLGVQLNVPASAVASVTGSRLTENIISLAGNGVESGQSKATFIVFDNAFAGMTRPGGFFVNTELTAPWVTPDTVRMDIIFATPQTPSALGTAPFNPFMISNLRRGYEVHLPASMPTDKADISVFGTYHNNTSSATNNYYKTKNNLPFALHIPASFDYPIEKQSVHNGHLKFTTWAQSGGTLFTDWYQNKPSYRNSSNLFIK